MTYSSSRSNTAFEVYGNYGVIRVNSASGEIIALNEADSDADETANYRDIRHFDVTEWRTHYSNERLEEAFIDILDIGFWFGDLNNYATAQTRDATR